MSSRIDQRGCTNWSDELFDVVGHSFNLRSTQQLSQVLFDEMKFPTRGLRKTASGQYSTAVDVLETLTAYGAELSTAQQRALDIILEQRQLEKLRGTYVDALPTLVNPATGRLHTSFSQTGAVTGPTEQQQPKLAEYPHPHCRGPRDPPRHCRAAGLVADLRRLQPGGVARACARGAGRTADRRVPA
jgi:DNA polymerase I-like protein with 3'-5' exonuclease and polymerase domains